MATWPQLRGMLLEEALAFLLRLSGYSPIDQPGNDPTLSSGPAGLEVLGRGANHQIDCVADYRIPQPFSHPPRLLVEAKCYAKQSVGIDIVRGGVGILKDVSEFWFTDFKPGSRRERETARAKVAKNRYHYQYAIASTSGFSEPAEQYAFAQDVYLIPMARQGFLQPTIKAIESLRDDDNYEIPWLRGAGALHSLRLEIRRALREEREAYPEDSPEFAMNNDDLPDFQNYKRSLRTYIRSLRKLHGGVLVTIANRHPILLVPDPELDLRAIPNRLEVEIQYEGKQWYLLRKETHQRAFSFDLPDALYDLYVTSAADGQGASPSQKVQALKMDLFTRFEGHILVDEQTPRLIQFMMTQDQADRLLSRLGESWTSRLQEGTPSEQQGRL